MKLVLDYTPLNHKTRPSIPNELGYPGCVAIDNPLGTFNAHRCTLHYVYASIGRIRRINNNFRIYYVLGIHLLTNLLTYTCASQKHIYSTRIHFNLRQRFYTLSFTYNIQHFTGAGTGISDFLPTSYK